MLRHAFSGLAESREQMNRKFVITSRGLERISKCVRDGEKSRLTVKLIFNVMAFDRSDHKIRSEAVHKEIQLGNDQEIAQSERNSHSINQGVGENLNDT